MSRITYLILLIVAGSWLMGCNRQDELVSPTPISAEPLLPANTLPTLAPPPAATLTPTPLPTPTPIPPVAVINGESISLSQYNEEMVKYQEWYPSGAPDGSPLSDWVLNLMIDQTLVRQYARANGITVDSATIEQKVAEAVTSSGGDEAYRVWLDNSGLTDQLFRAQVEAELLTQAVISAVTKDVPLSAETIHARHIQVADLTLAQTIHQELISGADFGKMVATHSLESGKEVTKGDLGTFNRGTLLIPEVEDVAFGLQPLQISDVFTVTYSDGESIYFIVQTLERIGQKPLSADEQAKAISQTFEQWLKTEREQAKIEKPLPLP